MQHVSPMDDVHLVAVRVAQVGPVVASAVSRAKSGRSLVTATRPEAGCMAPLDAVAGRRPERDHAAIDGLGNTAAASRPRPPPTKAPPRGEPAPSRRTHDPPPPRRAPRAPTPPPA